MVEFKGISFESIKVKVGSLIGRVFHKEEHNEKTLNVDASRTEVIGTQIGQQQIAQQIVLNLPEGLQQSEQTKLVKAVLGGANPMLEEAPVSTEANGDAQLPATTQSSPAEIFLKARYEEYVVDNAVLLDRGGLLLIYKERERISFTQEQLVFLTQSSFKNDFPAWFWMFNHRQRFESVVPLLQEVFKHPLQKIRRGVIKALTGFTDTGDEIVTLMQNEPHPEVIGFAASKFFEKDDLDKAQRIIANALTRKIIPILTEKGEKKSEKIQIDLGSAERRYLHSVIESGWSTEKLKALRILSLSAEENDLPFLETMLTKITYANIVSLVLSCIARIGKTSKADYIDKEMLETKWENSFISHLDALVAVKHKAIFPRLLKWLSDVDIVTNKFWWDEVNKRKVQEKIQSALLKLLDKDTYELLVQYILSRYSPDETGNIMSWRHFRVLKEAQTNPEIAPLLKSETRLSAFEPWTEMIEETELEEKTTAGDPEVLLTAVSTQESRNAFLVLRKLYTLISPEEALVKVSPIIKLFREDLATRLRGIASGEHSDEVKELAQNDLEKFLGDNRNFYRLQRKKKKNSRYDTEGDEDKEFDALSKDIENFSIIEKEYFTHIFKGKSPEIKAVLMDSIGRPYESIYDSITKDTEEKDALGDKLIETIRTSPNPLVRLKAIETLFRLDVANNDVLRAVTLTILVEARDKVKASRGMTDDSDDWFTSEIAYLWAVNALIEFCNPADFTYIQEATNREKILARTYHRYSNFFDYKVIEELLDLSENLEEEEEKENAMSALNSLDYAWTKKVLGIEN